MMAYKRFYLGLLAACLCGSAAATTLFPFYADVETEEGSFFAVRPLYSHTTVEQGEIRDFLWPVYSRKSFKDEQTSRAFFFYFTHQFDVETAPLRSRRWLLPVYFQGRDVQGKGYFALFPLGGTIREFLGRDEIAFALFPLFGKSRINDVKTTSVLWPIISHTRGEGIARDRVFPIIGKSVLEEKYEKRFVLWPFWTSATYFYPGDSGSAWMLFPLFGRTNLDKEKTTWVIPPFFRFTKGERQNRMYCPWPFFQKIESDSLNKTYVWPLWGRKQSADGRIDRTFVLWPLLWSERVETHELTQVRRKALPFFYFEKQLLREEGVAPEERTEVSKYWKIWPLMSWQREGDASRFRLLELWPLKDTKPVERNWAPLWTVYRRTCVEDTVSRDLLWFIWHSEENPAEDRSEWSLLKGFAGYKRHQGDRKFRFLWMNF